MASIGQDSLEEEILHLNGTFLIKYERNKIRYCDIYHKVKELGLNING